MELHVFSLIRVLFLNIGIEASELGAYSTVMEPLCFRSLPVENTRYRTHWRTWIKCC